MVSHELPFDLFHFLVYCISLIVLFPFPFFPHMYISWWFKLFLLCRLFPNGRVFLPIAIFGDAPPCMNVLLLINPPPFIFRPGRSGRAGRSGEAITFYTDDDIPLLRNVANAMSASGCEVPSWIMALPKRKWKKHQPCRDSISTKPKDEKD